MSDLEDYEHSLSSSDSESSDSVVRGVIKGGRRRLIASDSDPELDYESARSGRSRRSRNSQDDDDDDDDDSDDDDGGLQTNLRRDSDDDSEAGGGGGGGNSDSSDDEDGLGTATPRGGRRRYFEPKDISIKCYRCRQVGHISVHCVNESIEICALCGQRDHMIFRCPYEQCWKCLQPGHQQRNCPVSRPALPASWCVRCGSRAHIVDRCQWQPNKADQEQVHCHTCGRPGHIQCEVAKAEFVLEDGAVAAAAAEEEEEESSDKERKLSRRERKQLKIEQARERKQQQQQQRQGSAKFKSTLQSLLPMSRHYLKEHDTCPPDSQDLDPEQLHGAHFDRKSSSHQCPNCGARGHSFEGCSREVMRPVALTAMVNRKGPGSAQSKKCFNCNQTGHLSRDCPDKAAQMPQCYNCSMFGHISADCPQRNMFQRFAQRGIGQRGRLENGAQAQIYGGHPGNFHNSNRSAPNTPHPQYQHHHHHHHYGSPQAPPPFPLMALQQGFTPDQHRGGGGGHGNSSRTHTPQQHAPHSERRGGSGGRSHEQQRKRRHHSEHEEPSPPYRKRQRR